MINPKNLLLPSTPIDNFTLVSSSQSDSLKESSKITPYIATPYINIKLKHKHTKKLIKQVETLKQNLISSIPRTVYSKNPTRNDHDYKTYTSQSSRQQPLNPFPDNTYQNSPLSKYFTTDVTHDQMQDHSANITLNSTSHVDNIIIPSNRRNHPPRIKHYTRDV